MLSDDRTAEFYAGGRLAYQADGEPFRFDGARELAPHDVGGYRTAFAEVLDLRSGIDRVQAVRYYQHKLTAEAVVAGAGLPWSILRATQFHPLIDRSTTCAAKRTFSDVP